jgi:hypothetical protein
MSKNIIFAPMYHRRKLLDLFYSYALFDLVISVTHLLSNCYDQLDSGLIFLSKFDVVRMETWAYKIKYTLAQEIHV